MGGNREKVGDSRGVLGLAVYHREAYRWDLRFDLVWSEFGVWFDLFCCGFARLQRRLPSRGVPLGPAGWFGLV